MESNMCQKTGDDLYEIALDLRSNVEKKARSIMMVGDVGSPVGVKAMPTTASRSVDCWSLARREGAEFLPLPLNW